MSPEPLLAFQRDFRDAVLSAVAPEGRIAIYRNTVQTSLSDTLAAAYPVVARIVGPDTFEDVARRFVRAMPPRYAHLSAYGVGFPAFIAGDANVRALPYLGDVARLEWARAEAYFASDAPALDPSTLGAVAPDDLSQTVLTLHPATRLIASRYPIQRMWEVNQPAVIDVPAVNMTVPETVLVSRKDRRVVARKIAPADAVLVEAIKNGASLGAAFSQVQAADPAFDLEAALGEHLIHGTFRG